jgi:GNAT superfamily N-acetyltransferase
MQPIPSQAGPAPKFTGYATPDTGLVRFMRRKTDRYTSKGDAASTSVTVTVSVAPLAGVDGMTVTIRPATPADAGGIANVSVASVPYRVKPPAGVEFDLRLADGSHAVVADNQGSVDGYGKVSARDKRGGCQLTILVPPARRGRGIGSALLSALLDEARRNGARTVMTAVEHDSRAFAVRQGFNIGRDLSYSRADLSGLPPQAQAPKGMNLCEYTSLDPRAVWEAETATGSDDPSGLSCVPPYDDWLARRWHHPVRAQALSVAIMERDKIVAFAMTDADFGRKVVWSSATGTRPEYRGRGLAKAVKSAALWRCRAAGITVAYTGNDAANAPMLAINRWLGYQLTATSSIATKALDTRVP